MASVSSTRCASDEPLHHVYCTDDIMLLSLCHWSSFSSRPHELSFISFLLRPRTITCRDYSKSWPISGCVQKADCDSPGYEDQAMCCAACRPIRWSDRWRMQQCCDSYSKPQHWQVLRRLCCPMAHCWLQEQCYSAGVLQRCFWRTDKWRVHYGTSNPPTA